MAWIARGSQQMLSPAARNNACSASSWIREPQRSIRWSSLTLPIRETGDETIRRTLAQNVRHEDTP